MFNGKPEDVKYFINKTTNGDHMKCSSLGDVLRRLLNVKYSDHKYIIKLLFSTKKITKLYRNNL